VACWGVGLGLGAFVVVGLAQSPGILARLLPSKVNPLRRSRWSEMAQVVGGRNGRKIEIIGEAGRVFCSATITARLGYILSAGSQQGVRDQHDSLLRGRIGEQEKQFYFWPDYLGRGRERAVRGGVTESRPSQCRIFWRAICQSRDRRVGCGPCMGRYGGMCRYLRPSNLR